MERFITAYLRGPETRGNATQSAIQVGYSPRSARELTRRLTKHPFVQAQLARERAKQEQTRGRHLAHLRTVAYATLSEVATYDPLKGLQLLPDALRHPALETAKEWTGPVRAHPELRGGDRAAATDRAQADRSGPEGLADVSEGRPTRGDPSLPA
jgi:Terminase small subunit